MLGMYEKIIKRVIDVIMAGIIAIIFAVPMLIVAVIVRLNSKGPAIFKQTRIGKDGKEFVIYKFRTMALDSEFEGSGVYSGNGDDRVTGVGKILRATSIDELPQVINILKGDMSFIGPRPPLTYHPWTIDKYTEEQLRMFEVKPGITGWAQVNGRKCVEWNTRIKLNVWYVDNVSFLLDIKILFLTVISVLTNENNENTEATVKENVTITAQIAEETVPAEKEFVGH